MTRRPVALLLSSALAASLLLTPSIAAADDAGGDEPAAPPDKEITFIAELPHRQKALESAAQAVSTPGTSSFRDYRTVAQAAEAFGATDDQIAALRKAAGKAGLRVAVDPTRLVARITGTVRDWEKVMGTAITYAPSSPGSPTATFGFPVEPDVDKLPAPNSARMWDEYYGIMQQRTMGVPRALTGVVTRMVPSYVEYVPANDVPGPLDGLVDTDVPGTSAVTRELRQALAALPADVALPDELAGSGEAGVLTRSLYYPGSDKQAAPTNPAADRMRNCINSPDSPLAQGLDESGFEPDNFVGQEQVFDAYGLSGLQRSEGAAARNRVAILSMGGGFSEDDLRQAAECSGFTKPSVRITTGTGVPSPFVNVDDETTLDVQTVSATLRRATGIQLVQVNENVGGADLVDAYSRALTATPQPYSLTLSYGYCEPLYAGRDMFVTVDSLLEFAAVVGTTVAVSSGDGGSSVCQAQYGAFLYKVEVIEALVPILQASGDDALAQELEAFVALYQELAELVEPMVAFPRPTLGYPASSPYAMAVGGTQILMKADGRREGEVVWNDIPYSEGAIENLVGTGGPSAAFDAPWYQQPTTPANVRNVPDIAAMAGPTPGLPIVFEGQLAAFGGTSQASPMMAAAMALVSTREARAGRSPVGFPNPWLYDVARRHPSTMYDVTIGDNQFAVPYSADGLNIPACCQADLGYDLATGLGVPQFDVLVRHVQVQ